MLSYIEAETYKLATITSV